METTPQEQPRVKVLLLCTGTYASKDQTMVGFHRVTSLEPRDLGYDFKDTFYGTKAIKKAVGTPRAGYVYEVEATDDSGSTIYTGTMRYKGQWPDERARVEWASHDEARKRVWLAQKATSDASKINPLHEALTPVRDAYMRSVGDNRTQLLAAVVQFITTGQR
jgi:hypothetical protein